MEKEFSYFFDWASYSERAVMECALAEFAENGAKYVVVTNQLLERFLNEPNFFFSMKDMVERSGLKFKGCHGLWGGVKDLNGEDRQYRRRSIENHKLAMGYAADAGCQEYVVHIGAICCYWGRPFDLQKMRDLACQTLEQLLPEAEKLGIIIAVENSFEPTNSADEVLYFLNKFPSPYMGACYDSGHANILTSVGKDPSGYGKDLLFPWNGKIIFEDHTLEKLAPHIVTCHLHDNNGYLDQHDLPGTGTVCWETLIRRLSECPRILSMQCEVSALSHRVPIRRLCTTFNGMKKYMA